MSGRMSDQKKPWSPKSWISAAYGTSIKTRTGILTNLRCTATQMSTSAQTATSQTSAIPPMNSGLTSGTACPVNSSMIITTGGIERPVATANISQSIGPPRFMEDVALMDIHLYQERPRSAPQVDPVIRLLTCPQHVEPGTRCLGP